MPTSDKDNGEAGQSKKARVDHQTMPTRQYLDQAVVPVVLQAMSAVAKERPADPLEFIANYLLKEAKNRSTQTSETAAQAIPSASA
ncbi:hypothetical protein DAPPUDRAFT_304485 [Daphnia pulex]|uniref:Protein dpy-30 homolog n=2 Tax=Daphnia pulex TaxID=6669 RepID=E9GLL2_DAPPU|nr:hypothetical protein DAPPUDRAFT_304485 [Daphnia pulex]|eukprot:EFX79530.1 hypothetical protein DAPPUDRAFT_304485 [Daphnia pulex]